MQITWLQDTNCGQENDQSHSRSLSRLPITRYQSPKWHINIIARESESEIECALRHHRTIPSHFSHCPEAFVTVKRIKGAEFFFTFFLSYLVSHFFHFRCSVHALNFHSGLSILKGVWKCRRNKKKIGEKCATLWHLWARLPAKQEAKKYTIKKQKRKMKKETRTQSVMF